jgi:glycine hydroxymethyltransferase
VALKLAHSPTFKEYQEQVLRNCQSLAESLKAGGIDLVSGGSDNHLLLIDLRNKKSITGNQAEKLCEQVGLVLNKNTVPGDKSAINPSGLRVGTPAMTSRGATEADFKQIGQFIVQAVEITKRMVDTGYFKNLAEFTSAIPADSQAAKLKIQVENFASKFETIGSRPL